MRPMVELLAELKRLEEDERLWYETANVEINAPLALIQLGLETKSDILRWCLQLPSRPRERRDLHESYEKTP